MLVSTRREIAVVIAVLFVWGTICEVVIDHAGKFDNY